ncbi:MAG TPA: GNAT family N-acetyltransferase [Novosphingobium sp.]|nr:GNAT family N-acetyltransferase [Novosphingobium sp.]
MIAIRPASPDDLPLVASLIRGLAEYEGLSHAVRMEEATLGEYLFGARPMAEVVIGECDGVPSGFALFFHNFSTFEGRPGIWLEDLFVLPAARRSGLGTALLAHVAGIARTRGCARLEWTVLDWNMMAIQFYRSLGARALTDWTTMRLDTDSLERLSAHAAGSDEARL